MRSVAVVQARMGSSRLPGKVLMPLAGRPVLDHVVRRVAAAQRISQVIVATSDQPMDDAIEAYCADKGWSCVRGPESDVLGRFALAIAGCDAELVARVTSDCPLFSPAVLDGMLASFDPEAMDYMSTNWPERSFPVGLDCEVMRRSALLHIAGTASDPYDREHVTPHFYRHPDRYRLAGYPCGHKLDDIRITLDTADDYERLERLLEAHPEVADPATDVVATAAAYFQRA